MPTKTKAPAKKAQAPAVTAGNAGITEQQKKWFASVREGLERDTGKSMDEWIKIARKCPETKPKARVDWLRANHGLGVNRAAIVLDAAFAGDNMGWDNPDALVAALWKNPDQLKIHDALVAHVSKMKGAIVGEKKSFTGFSRSYQFAAIRPTKDGVRLGLAVPLNSSKRLEAPKKNEGWSDRNKGVAVLTSTKDIDAEIKTLLKTAFDAS
ncbi:MAG TPA: DUF5655 domain-containing protein [Hyphomonadaceae bacterium]|jgi:hypothetical protein|nr:DUF5655 domain-containing protein [Hyphomonadaceae bacterium]